MSRQNIITTPAGQSSTPSLFPCYPTSWHWTRPMKRVLLLVSTSSTSVVFPNKSPAIPLESDIKQMFTPAVPNPVQSNLRQTNPTQPKGTKLFSKSRHYNSEMDLKRTHLLSLTQSRHTLETPLTRQLLVLCLSRCMGS